jgi:hypothetical protein
MYRHAPGKYKDDLMLTLFLAVMFSLQIQAY